MLFTDLYWMKCSMAFNMSITVSKEIADGRIFKQASLNSGKSNLGVVNHVTQGVKGR